MTTAITDEQPEECPNCHKIVDPFNKNIHPACREAFMQFPPILQSDSKTTENGKNNSNN
jgi:hypothetical protein